MGLRQIGERVGLHFSAVGRPPLCFSSRDRFICKAVEEQGYRASEVADYVRCQPSKISRAVQKARS